MAELDAVAATSELRTRNSLARALRALGLSPSPVVPALDRPYGGGIGRNPDRTDPRTFGGGGTDRNRGRTAGRSAAA